MLKKSIKVDMAALARAVGDVASVVAGTVGPRSFLRTIFPANPSSSDSFSATIGNFLVS